MAQLPPHRLPHVLRFLAWLILVMGILGTVSHLGIWLAGRGELRLVRLVTGALWVTSARSILKGSRDGVSSMLWVFVLGLVAVGFLFFAGLVPKGSKVPFWIGTGLLLLVTPYLAWARYGLDWDEEERGDDESDHDHDDDSGDGLNWPIDPDARDAKREWLAMRDEQLAADDVDPPDPDELVEELLYSSDSELTRHRLLHEGERATQALCRALGQQRFRENEEAVELVYDLGRRRGAGRGAPDRGSRAGLRKPMARSRESSMRFTASTTTSAGG